MSGLDFSNTMPTLNALDSSYNLNPMTQFPMPDFLSMNLIPMQNFGGTMPSFQMPDYFGQFSALNTQLPSAQVDTAAQKKEKVKKYTEAIKQQDTQIKELVQTKETIVAQQSKDSKPAEKLGFWEGLGHLAKGALNSVTGLFTDDKGKLLKTAAIAAVVITAEVLSCGALTPVLIGAGAIMGGTQAIKGGVELANAKNKEEQIKALENIGEGTAVATMSLVGIRGLRAAKIAKAEKLAGSLESTFKNSNVENSMISDAINSIKDSKGKSIKIKNALGDLSDLTENKEALADLHNQAKNSMLKFKKTASINFDKGKLTSELGKISEIEGVVSKEQIKSAIDNLNKAANKKEILKAISDARALVSKANDNLNNGTYNELKVLLNQSERQIQASRFGLNVKSDLTAIKSNFKDQVVQHPGKSVFHSYIGTKIISDAFTQDEVSEEDLKKQAQEKEKVELQKTQLAEIDAKLDAENKEKLNQLKALAEEMNVVILDSDTKETLQAKIDATLKA